MNKNKVIILILVIIAILVIAFISKAPPDQIPEVKNPENISPIIMITSQEIKEDNFTGERPIISGDSELAIMARTYADNRIAEFKAQADKDVPAMRAEFGADSPTANYVIYIKGEFLRSEKIDAIVMSEYVYTGGANGNSSYMVFNTSRATGKILTLADIIPEVGRNEFTKIVKKLLNEWRPEGIEGPAIFPEVLDQIDFAMFRDWSLDGQNLYIYFDKYEIGPGALGAVVFPIAIPYIKSMISDSFIPTIASDPI